MGIALWIALSISELNMNGIQLLIDIAVSTLLDLDSSLDSITCCNCSEKPPTSKEQIQKVGPSGFLKKCRNVAAWMAVEEGLTHLENRVFTAGSFKGSGSEYTAAVRQANSARLNQLCLKVLLS